MEDTFEVARCHEDEIYALEVLVKDGKGKEGAEEDGSYVL